MKQPNNYIEINGKKYDAFSGRPLQSPHYSAASDSASIEGVIRRPHAMPGQITRPQKITVPAAEPRSPKSKPKTPHAQRIIKPAEKSPQKSTTLMRPAVKKPKHVAPPVNVSAKKLPKVNPIPEERLKRAGEVKKSPHVKRFNFMQQPADIVKKFSPVPVVKEVREAALETEEIIDEQIDQTIDKFEEAIAGATSHLEEYVEEHKPARSKKLAFASASVLSLLLVAFVLYQAVPEVKVKMASSRAGFSADVPKYSPAGYGLSGDIQTTSGELKLVYNSRSNDTGYVIKQQPSNWNSQSLINNFLLAENKTYQTYEANGKTVYVYEDTNATWVDGGIWYKIEGDASLTSDQLLRIANSL